MAGAPLGAQACRELTIVGRRRPTRRSPTSPRKRRPSRRSSPTWAPPTSGPANVRSPLGRELGVYRRHRLGAAGRQVRRTTATGTRARPSATVLSDSCIVVEIPAAENTARATPSARAALDSLTRRQKGPEERGSSPGALWRVVTGAAFFDGQHRRGGARSYKIDGEHGRCNSSVRALWRFIRCTASHSP